MRRSAARWTSLCFPHARLLWCHPRTLQLLMNNCSCALKGKYLRHGTDAIPSAPTHHPAQRQRIPRSPGGKHSYALPSKGITNKQLPQFMKASHFPSKDTANFPLIPGGAAEEMTAPPGADYASLRHFFNKFSSGKVNVDRPASVFQRILT